MINSHVHSDFSIDASMSLRGICKTALEKGVDRVAITNHLVLAGETFLEFRKFTGILKPPLIAAPPLDEWKTYFQEFKIVREEFPDLQLAFGIEADYHPKILDEVRKILESVSFDFVLGSTHFLENHCISSKKGAAAFLQGHSIEEYFEAYFKESREAAASGLFDSMAHLDYCLESLAELRMKTELRDYEEFAKKSIDEIARKKIAIEVNSGGLRKTVKNIFPSLELLEYAASVGVPAVTIGSDAHRIEEFDSGLREAVEIALKAGFENARFFVARKPEEIPLSSL